MAGKSKRKRNVRDLPLEVEACGCEESEYLWKKLWRAEWRIRVARRYRMDTGAFLYYPEEK